MKERKTKTSQAVLKVLKSSNQPLTVSDILNELKNMSMRPNKTTVYRMIEKFVSKKAVTEIHVKNKAVYYELTRSHHHHFICNTCSMVFCLNGCGLDMNEKKLQQILPYKKAVIHSHEFNLYGTCENCLTN